MLNTITLEQARNNIEQGIQACQKLLISLEDERQALKDRDTDTLAQVIKDKSTSLLTLEQSSKQRTSWVAAEGPDTVVEQAWIAHIKTLDPKLEDNWLQFKGLLEDCRTHNEINGKMLARSRQVFKRVIAITRGQTDQQPLYTPKGNRGAGKGYHNLGEA